MIPILWMIDPGSVNHLMRFDTLTVDAGDNQDVAMTPHLVADSPALHVRAVWRDVDNMRARGQCAFPSALPVRRRGAASGQEQQNNG